MDSAEIFYTIADIAKLIPIDKYIKLNNQLQDLITKYNNLQKENKELKLKLENQDHICKCESFKNNIIKTADDYQDYFCLESLDKLKECKNFKELLLDIPLLQNLFEKVDLPFAEDISDKEYNFENFKSILHILIMLNIFITNSRSKIIVMLCIFHYLIINFKFCTNYPNFFSVGITKFDEVIKDNEFINITKEFNIDIDKWKKIFL